ncbi:MAG: hypothetical protein FGM40_05620 [Rhodocyclaceae bacterium]|nr:hypothetical protein [Rhodocyclaceae bacterium]
MLRVLVCIPHYFRRAAEDSGVANGSNRDTLAARLSQVSYCLSQLTAVLGSVRFLMGSPGRIAHEQVIPVAQKVGGDVVMVSAPDNHLFEELGGAHGFQGVLWPGPPRQLGYHCRRVFARHAGHYDFYLFIEDDTTILDPAFFRKVAAFYRAHGEDCILQPNRFEIFSHYQRGWRAYLDQPAFPVHRVAEQPGPATLTLPDFDGEVLFHKTTDAMSGAYVITDRQLRRWMDQTDFHAPAPADLAAGLDPIEITQFPLGGSLPVYRPAPQNLDFLEVHHVPNRLSGLKTPSRKIREHLAPILQASALR